MYSVVWMCLLCMFNVSLLFFRLVFFSSHEERNNGNDNTIQLYSHFIWWYQRHVAPAMTLITVYLFSLFYESYYVCVVVFFFVSLTIVVGNNVSINLSAFAGYGNVYSCSIYVFLFACGVFFFNLFIRRQSNEG